MLNGKRELREIYETGQGPVRLRGEYTVETLLARASGRSSSPRSPTP